MNEVSPLLPQMPSLAPAASSFFTVSPIADPAVTPICPNEPTPATAQVIHVINGEHYSGAERVQDGLALILPQFGFEVQFACLKPGRFPTVRRSQQSPLFNLPMAHRWDLAVASQIARLVERSSSVLLHAHTPRAALITARAARKAAVPWIYHAHSPTLWDSKRWLKNIVVATLDWWAVRRADHIIAVSESLKQYWERWGVPAERITVVHNGVPSWPVLTKRPDPSGFWTVGTVALFRPRKGVEVLLRAMQRLRGEGVPIRLLAVGPFETPQYESRVKRLASRLELEDAISWIGFTPQVESFLTKMDLFVLPSLFGEGLPMVVLEAMALGVPVVASRVEGVTEVIRNGRDGLLVPPGSAPNLAESLKAIISGQISWRWLRENAYHRQRNCFSLESMGRATAEVYRCVLRAQTRDRENH
ncbi:MAG: glycosyltransferase family 4 protein [Thermogutta sp.]